MKTCALARTNDGTVETVQAGMGSLRWLSFWDEGHYDPQDFEGWANFGFTRNVSSICEGAVRGQRHLLK
eukprot:scaffold53371_cov37-Prasinocladus_malaysianus.AAC.1